MRLIDADALKETICDNVYSVTDFFNSRDYGMFWTGGIEKAINEAPTIDAEPVKHGMWIGKPMMCGYSRMRCSVCDNVFLENKEKWSYCPCCGARMEGVGE